jgi:dTDP-glucose 4,6-dehydratase
MKVIVTGGAGFIGSALIRHILGNKQASVVNLDKLTYAGNLESLSEIENNKSYKFLQVDIVDHSKIEEIFLREKPDFVMHLAAESHVDRSIDGPKTFLDTNIMGTYSLLEASRKYLETADKNIRDKFCFLHISTDEVFGSLDKVGLFNEASNYSPNSPYSASKAASDHLVRSWGATYNIPYLITNCSNNFGPFQHPEKLIPTTIINAIKGNNINIYGTGKNIRDWLYVDDHVSALWQIINSNKRKETFCIGGNNEKTNLQVVSEICNTLNEINKDNSQKTENYLSLIKMVPDRPGHDMRYAINSEKLFDTLNWEPSESFNSGLEKTVRWYLDNQDWCERALSGSSTQIRLGLKGSR